MITEISPRPCPLCGCMLHPRALIEGDEKVRAAVLFTDCLRRCDTCRIGLSNARTVGTETVIYEDPSGNVPLEMRRGFAEALQSSVNLLNRPNKLVKASYSTSEDALTWTMFRFLYSTGRLREVFAASGVAIAKHATTEPKLILWGAEVHGEDASPARTDRVVTSQVPDGLADASKRLGESADRRTEPDVVLDFGVAGIVFIEVKYRSGNEIKPPEHEHWGRYLDCDQQAGPFKIPAEVRINGHYELARNWSIAWELSRVLKVPVALINLGKDDLFEGAFGRRLGVFESLLSRDAAHAFYRLSWRQLLDVVGGTPPWLNAYLAHRSLAPGSPADREPKVIAVRK